MKKTKKYAWVMDAFSQTPFSTKARAMKHFLTGKKSYLPKKKTQADMESVIKCALCPNMCRFDCPVLEAEKNEATSPSGKMRIAYLIETDRLDGTDAFELMYKCAGCDACVQWCPFDFSVNDILKGVRADIVADNRTPEDIVKIKEHLEKNHTMDKINVDVKGSEKGDILYFMGCTILSEKGEIAEAMIDIFNTVGEKYAIIRDEWCCGAPLINLGFTEVFKHFAEHNVEKIKESGCKTVVCSCPTCAYMLRQVYSQMDFEIKAQVLHSSEYLLSLMKDKKIRFDHLEKECVYHDPCTLVRKLGIEEEPRKVLENIPGMVVKEPYFNRKDTKCCGRGGSLGSTNPDIAEKIAQKRVAELRKEAECIVTACPTCTLAFNGCEIYDISEIVVKSLEKKNE